MSDLVYSGMLENKIPYEIHQSSGFSNKCDLAIKIRGEYAAILTVIPKRKGNVETLPMLIGRLLLPPIEGSPEALEAAASTVSPEEPAIDLLSDIVDTEQSS